MDVGLFVGIAALHLYFSSKSKRCPGKTASAAGGADGDDENHQEDHLRRTLQDGTSLNASEAVCIVTHDNQVITANNNCDGKIITRAEMRLHNLWHRATYILIRHEPEHGVEQHGNDPSDVWVLVQKRSSLKDYCPGKLDPTPGGVVGYGGETYRDNAIRELDEEMGIVIDEDDDDDPALSSSSSSQPKKQQRDRHSTLRRLFTFPYQDARVKVWGEFMECIYRGALRDLKLQASEVASVERMSLQALNDLMQQRPHDFMPDALHAMQLYMQRRQDVKVDRRLLHGYSSSNLDDYKLRPKLKALFFDCDDCLYQDDWKVAKLLTQKIEDYCVVERQLRPGQAYELYQQYGTALRGLLAEGYLSDSPQAIDDYLYKVHDIPIQKLLQRDNELVEVLKCMDPAIPRYIFTASVHHHAQRCLQALGIESFFEPSHIIDCKACDLETKHSRHSFEQAMKIAGVKHPVRNVHKQCTNKNRQISRMCVVVCIQTRSLHFDLSIFASFLYLHQRRNVSCWMIACRISVRHAKLDGAVSWLVALDVIVAKQFLRNMQNYRLIAFMIFETFFRNSLCLLLLLQPAKARNRTRKICWFLDFGFSMVNECVRRDIS
jgi:putative hydrolase of the HAD superfamily